MPLLASYHLKIEQKELEYDSNQLIAVNTLNSLVNKLNKKQVLTPMSCDENVCRGVYLWGKVGRGKTMLMDMFYQQLAIKDKQRIHFHHFMERVHQQLAQLTGHSDPLKIIAKKWAENIDVICFDEFFVNDIGDAMLLAGLFEALFSQNVVLVATSNCAPEQLYRNGLQRERFLPTIDLLINHCDVIAVDGSKDHRLKGLNYHHYYYPNEDSQTLANKVLFEQRFNQLCCSELTANRHYTGGEIVINDRPIRYIAQGKNTRGRVIWFDFFDLCSGPRSQRDYMYIAKEFSVVLLSNVPKFSGKLVPAVFSGIEDCYQRNGVLLAKLRHLDDEARRFIALVDEFYDKKINLIIKAEVDIFELYQGEQLAFEFARCESRLVAMQDENFGVVQ
jgi:cell division protein ZapE